MKLREQVWTIRPTVPTASMADIAFLLIIFFMLTTTFSPERTSVQLPQSMISSKVSEEAAIVAITADGSIVFTSGEEESYPLSGPEELGVLAQTIIDLVPSKEFVIKADRQARYQAIDSVLGALRENGVKRIGLLTRPEAGSQSYSPITQSGSDTTQPEEEGGNN
jgi:biopolymer transport protein ExbD